MVRWIRRVITLGALGGAGAAGTKYVRGRRRRGVEASTEWPSFTPAPVRLADHDVSSVTSADDVAPAFSDADTPWAEPVDGACPPGYPIKGNASSKIFHVPGGRSYERTIPERCYATAEAALADGFRAAKA